MASITSANAIFMLVIPGLFPIPQQLQGFAADDVFTNEAVTPVVAVMGVDGNLSGGFTPVPKPQAIMLQADSDSNIIFETWQAAQEALVDIYPATAIITLPGISRVYACTKGLLTSWVATPDARRTLQPRRYQITWEKIVGAPV